MFATLLPAPRTESASALPVWSRTSSLPETDADAAAAMLAVAQAFSPRIERIADVVICDLSGLERLFGTTREIAEEMRRDAANRGLPVRIAVAGTRTAARLLAYGRPGITVIEPGEEAAALAPLPLRVLGRMILSDLPSSAPAPVSPSRVYRTSPMAEIARAGAEARLPGSAARRAQDERYADLLETLQRWGIRTLGDLAALPTDALSERLGHEGVALQRLARGEEAGPLVPLVPEERFEGHLDLEWPIEGIEPLSFVLGRLLDPISEHLERRGRAAAAIVLTLRLVSRDTHERRLQLPAPIRDAKVLRTLLLLDLESNPPSGGIDAVTIHVEPTPGRVLQHSLLERAHPKPEQLTTLLARLSALMGHDRCGAPRVPDTHRPGAFEMTPFSADRPPSQGSREPAAAPDAAAAEPALRRYRHPVPIRVTLEGSRPVRVIADRTGIASGCVQACAGPWRTSGEWWTDGWHRDEWDVALDDGTVCRIFQDRGTKGWFMDAVVD